MTTATKCEKCKMTYQGFHICVDLSYRAPGEHRARPEGSRKWEKPIFGDFRSWNNAHHGRREHSPDVNPASWIN